MKCKVCGCTNIEFRAIAMIGLKGKVEDNLEVKLDDIHYKYLCQSCKNQSVDLQEVAVNDEN